MKPKIKICCISSVEEAFMAIESGTSALGLVGKMPSGPGIISDHLISEIAGKVPHEIETFLLTSETTAEGIIVHHQLAGTTTIQIVDTVSVETYRQLRDVLPDVHLVQVIHVMDEHSIEEAIAVSSFVDAILLDSGNPNLQVKELGGTGRVHNWNLSRSIVNSVNIPVYLAGGLHSGNVQFAIQEVGPFGLDLCSGVRTNGKLDQLKLTAFFDAVNSIDG